MGLYGYTDIQTLNRKSIFIFYERSEIFFMRSIFFIWCMDGHVSGVCVWYCSARTCSLALQYHTQTWASVWSTPYIISFFSIIMAHEKFFYVFVRSNKQADIFANRIRLVTFENSSVWSLEDERLGWRKTATVFDRKL